MGQLQVIDLQAVGGTGCAPVVVDGTAARITVSENGNTPEGPRPNINFIGASGITIIVADDPANDEIDVTIAGGGGSSASDVTIRVDSGPDVGTRPRLNLIPGLGMQIDAVDDSGSNEIDITFTASGVGGGGATPATIAPPKVNNASALGSTSARYAREDHTHQGVNLDENQTITGTKTVVSGIIFSEITDPAAAPTDSIRLYGFDQGGTTVLRGRGPSLAAADVVQIGGQLGNIGPSPDVRGIRETGGPTNLTIGAIASGDLLLRSGSNVIGVSSGIFQAADPDLNSIANLGTTGIVTRTAANTWATRTFQPPAAGITITNPAGIAGDPTLVLANDLAALEALTPSGFAFRTGTDTWSLVQLSAIDHNGLMNLNSGDAHKEYFKLAGRQGGQTAAGGTGGTDPLILRSNPTNAGSIILGDDITAESSVVIHGTGTGITIDGSAFDTHLIVHDQNAFSYQYFAHKHNGTGLVGTGLGFGRSRGTESGETVVLDNDVIARLDFLGYDGTDYAYAANIHAVVDDPSPGPTSMGGELLFFTTPVGSTTLAQRMRIGNDGTVELTGNLGRIRNVPLTWPAANTSGVLANDGTGSLSWATVTGGGGSGTPASVAPPKVADASVLGVSTAFAREDHTHQGVNLDEAQTITGTKTVVSGIIFSEIADPSNPPADSIRLYGFDQGGTTVLRARTAAGVSADVAQIAGQLGNIGASPDVRGLRETSGPTLLTYGGIGNGELLIRSGTTVIGVSSGIFQAADPDLNSLANLSTTGLVTRTASDTYTTRTLQQPAAGITITNPAGLAGDPTLVLANDLAALEALTPSGFAFRTGTDAWSLVQLSAIDHNGLMNLSSGDSHKEYLRLAGRQGGQTANGGTSFGEDLILQPNPNYDYNASVNNMGVGVIYIRGRIRNRDVFTPTQTLGSMINFINDWGTTNLEFVFPTAYRTQSSGKYNYTTTGAQAGPGGLLAFDCNNTVDKVVSGIDTGSLTKWQAAEMRHRWRYNAQGAGGTRIFGNYQAAGSVDNVNGQASGLATIDRYYGFGMSSFSPSPINYVGQGVTVDEFDAFWCPQINYGGIIGELYGLAVEDQNTVSNDIITRRAAVRSRLTYGGSRFGLYFDGDASNVLAGSLRIGDSTSPKPTYSLDTARGLFVHNQSNFSASGIHNIITLLGETGGAGNTFNVASGSTVRGVFMGGIISYAAGNPSGAGSGNLFSLNATLAAGANSRTMAPFQMINNAGAFTPDTFSGITNWTVRTILHNPTIGTLGANGQAAYPRVTGFHSLGTFLEGAGTSTIAVSDWTSVYCAAPSVVGTPLATRYTALEIDDFSLATTMYSIHSKGSAFQMVHAGPALFGADSSPSANLAVDIAGGFATHRTDISVGATTSFTALNIGNSSYVRMHSASGGAFTIHGVAGGVDGKRVIIYNQNSVNMSIADDSGTEGTAANRIYTPTGGTMSTTGTGSCELIYDTSLTHGAGNNAGWVLLWLQN